MILLGQHTFCGAAASASAASSAYKNFHLICYLASHSAHFSMALCCVGLWAIPASLAKWGMGGLSLLVNFCEPNCLIIKCHSSLWRLPNWQRPQKGVKIADCHHLAHAHLPPHRPFENWPKRVGICGKYTYEHIYT